MLGDEAAERRAFQELCRLSAAAERAQACRKILITSCLLNRPPAPREVKLGLPLRPATR